MHICIDIQAAIAQRAGVGRYVKCLVEHLGPLAGDDLLSLFYFDFQRHGIPFPAPQSTPRACRWIPGRLAQGAWKMVGWPPFDWFAGSADLYHFPNFVVPPLGRGRSVVTIHDMSFQRFPAFAETRNLNYLNATIRHTAERADAIITDSQFSADEICSLLGVSPERVFPIHLGIAPGFRAPAPEAIAALRREHGLDGPYLLTVGTIEPRKNIEFLIEVFERLTGFDGSLVIAGMPGWKCEPIMARMRNSSCADRIRYVQYMPDHQLPALYAGAALFVYPSLYEGFGLPPLEGMACGTPVLTSDGGSLGEVVGGGAAVLPASSPVEAWVAQIDMLLGSTDHRQSLIDRGRAWAGRYTWQATAQRTWDVYRKVAA
jgi:glycosyltransferase involved in cell wall biosynthesis